MLKACGYYILVEIPEKEDVKKSGIIIPDAVREDNLYNEEIGIVLDIGPTCFSGMEALMGIDGAIERAAKWGFKIGDTVKFTRYDGSIEDKSDGRTLRLIQDQQVKARIEA